MQEFVITETASTTGHKKPLPFPIRGNNHVKPEDTYDHPIDDSLSNIHIVISKRIERLQESENELQIMYRKSNRIALASKISLVILGAFSVTIEPVNLLLGTSNLIVTISYMTTAALITAIAGIEMACRWDSSAIKLQILGAECRVKRRKAQYTLENIDSIKQIEKNRLKKMYDMLLIELNNTIEITEAKQAELDVHLAHEVQRSLPEALEKAQVL